MKTTSHPMPWSLLAGLSLGFRVLALEPLQCALTYQTNREALLTVPAPSGTAVRLEYSHDLRIWSGWITLLSSGTVSGTDSGAPFQAQRFYRAAALPDATAVTGDHLETDEGEVVIHPINHATFTLHGRALVIYVDPVGGAARFTGLPRADLILVTHGHSDHLDANTISSVKGANAVILAPKAVYQALPTALRALTTVLTNGASTNLPGLKVDAVPAYNLTSTFHPKGDGNGYVLTLGGKRVYIAGDTEDIPEMKALNNIDVAFVPMNLPYTMTVAKAASVVRQFRPKVVYPYHYSGSDTALFKRTVGTDVGVEVRLRNWY